MTWGYGEILSRNGSDVPDVRCHHKLHQETASKIFNFSVLLKRLLSRRHQLETVFKFSVFVDTSGSDTKVWVNIILKHTIFASMKSWWNKVVEVTEVESTLMHDAGTWMHLWCLMSNKCQIFNHDRHWINTDSCIIYNGAQGLNHSWFWCIEKKISQKNYRTSLLFHVFLQKALSDVFLIAYKLKFLCCSFKLICLLKLNMLHESRFFCCCFFT